MLEWLISVEPAVTQNCVSSVTYKIIQWFWVLSIQFPTKTLRQWTNPLMDLGRKLRKVDPWFFTIQQFLHRLIIAFTWKNRIMREILVWSPRVKCSTAASSWDFQIRGFWNFENNAIFTHSLSESWPCFLCFFPFAIVLSKMFRIE